MNQEKCGKFIAKMRKEKEMTQEDLAIKMGVSINAVSKWERGLSFPDVSLYKRLCQELEISIEELINGEEDNSEEAKEKAIILTVKEKDKIRRNFKKILILIVSVFILIFFILYFLNTNLKINLINDSNYLYDEVIEFLRENEFSENTDAIYYDFNVFYSYYAFGIEEKNEYKYVYMWICGYSYYVEEDGNGALTMLSATWAPIKAIFKNDEFQEIIYPENGDGYTSSVKKIFPHIISNQVLNFESGENIDKLISEVMHKKNIYYDYLNFDMSTITLNDLIFNGLIFSIEVENSDCDIPVTLSVYDDNTYKLYVEYEACKPAETCTAMLIYTGVVEGTYDYDILEIIKHSTYADSREYSNESSLKYMIYSGQSGQFFTNDDNKYLNEFLKLIDVDLTKCAKPVYID